MSTSGSFPRCDFKNCPTHLTKLSVVQMSLNEKEIRQSTLADYVRQRNGVPLGGRGSMGNMLYRSFGAASFTGFWRYWNPIFGYYLHRCIYLPLRNVTPRWIALVLTFLFCGALHDGVTYMVQGSTAFLFTTMFLFFAIGLLIGATARLDISNMPWFVRALINLSYLSACIALAYYVRSVVPSWPKVR